MNKNVKLKNIIKFSISINMDKNILILRLLYCIFPFQSFPIFNSSFYHRVSLDRFLHLFIPNLFPLH